MAAVSARFDPEAPSAEELTPPMTVSIQKPNWRGAAQTLRERTAALTQRLRAADRSGARRSSSAAVGSATAAARPSRPRPAINSAWVLVATMGVLCGVALGWLFSNGTAAVIWLIALIVVALAGVPIALVVLRLFGFEDPD